MKGGGVYLKPDDFLDGTDDTGGDTAWAMLRRLLHDTAGDRPHDRLQTQLMTNAPGGTSAFCAQALAEQQYPGHQNRGAWHLQ
jgi:hypothetical protein